ncbi:MAG: hypothetical protein J0M00_26010, partial [Burkholderiales bacterium]|nr:hypothetical protein [Burkholderiales bacterium]
VGLQSSGNIVANPGPFFILSTVITLTGGTMFLMWLGEQITSRGVGNGVSLIIFAGIVAGLPQYVVQALELTRTGSMTAGATGANAGASSAASRACRLAANSSPSACAFFFIMPSAKRPSRPVTATSLS